MQQEGELARVQERRSSLEENIATKVAPWRRKANTKLGRALSSYPEDGKRSL